LKKQILLILMLLLMPFSFSHAASELLGHVLYYYSGSSVVIQTSPSGAEWIPGQKCGANYKKNEGINYLGKQNKKDDGCSVCFASNGEYLNHTLGTIVPPTDYKILSTIANAFERNLSLGTIYFSNPVVYQCSNGSFYNVMNVYFDTTEYVNLKIIGGEGDAYINGECTREKTFPKGSNPTVDFLEWSGETVTQVLINGIPSKPEFPQSIYLEKDTVVKITTQKQPITPKVEIYDANGNLVTNTQMLSDQAVTIKDTSQYLSDPLNNLSTNYSGNNRIWQIWDDNLNDYITLYRHDVYNDGDKETLFTDESFQKYIPADNKAYTYRVVHYHVYDNEVVLPVNSDMHVMANAWIGARIPDPGTGTDPSSITADFKIFYTAANSNTPQDVTDKNWTNPATLLSVKLKPNDLDKLDASKIKWETANKNIKITPSTDGTATALIPSNTRIEFSMYYDTNPPVQHATYFSNSSITEMTSVSSEFRIKHNEKDVTDIEWESASDAQQVTLIPEDLTQTSYYWEYKDLTMATWNPLPNGQSNQKQPTFKVSYNKYYTFKLTVNKGTSKELSATHTTIMLPPDNPLKVDVTLSTPAEYNIHDIPDGEDVYVTPVHITLKPNFPEGFVLDNTWHWEVWLTGQNNRINETKYLLLNADTYNENAPDNYIYNTIDDTQFNTLPNSSYFTYKSLPYTTTEITIPYWRTDKDPGRRIIFEAYARLVCNDGRMSDYDTYASFTLLVDKVSPPPSPEEFKEYITSIDELYPEYPDDNAAIVEAGSSIPFSADISKTNSITISANKDILAQSGYTNSGTNTKFKTDIQLKSTGDYDDGKDYNLLTITGHHINGIHTATQQLKIKPNWYIGKKYPTGGGGGGSDPDPTPDDDGNPNNGNKDESALRVISTRDLRWQSLFSNGALNWGLSTANATTKPLLPNDVKINGVSISPIKTGYAVEFTFDTTKVFNEKPDDNIQINVSFKKNGTSINNNRLYYQNTYGGEFKSLDKHYTSFNLDTDANAKKVFNITKTTRADGGARYKFVYYLPGTLKVDKAQPQTGDRLDVYFNISARRGTTEYFNYNSLASKLYKGWSGWVFSYDLTRNNLQDIGNNAN